MRITKNTTDYPNKYILYIAKKACKGIDTRGMKIEVLRTRGRFPSGRARAGWIRIRIPDNPADIMWRRRGYKRELDEFYLVNFEIMIFIVIAHEAWHHIQGKQGAFHSSMTLTERELECDDFAYSQLENVGYKIKRVDTTWDDIHKKKKEKKNIFSH